MAPTITDPDFARAVALIDAGDTNELARLVDAHPRLLSEPVPLSNAQWGAYFANPRLIWFVAENPIRNGRLPANIADVTQTLIDAARRHGEACLTAQLDYTLALTASGRIARESGQQAPLIATLVQAGANPDGAVRTAAAHGERAACRALIAAGAKPSLHLAAALDDPAEVDRLAPAATPLTLQEALAIAAYNGAADACRRLLAAGADPNQYNPEGCHAHTAPIHQAVYAGSLETVKALITGGADPQMRDRTFGGTALGWAQHNAQPEIAEYLR